MLPAKRASGNEDRGEGIGGREEGLEGEGGGGGRREGVIRRGRPRSADIDWERWGLDGMEGEREEMTKGGKAELETAMSISG